MGEGIEDLWNEFLVHADAGILDDESQRGPLAFDAVLLNREMNMAFMGEFDRVAKNIDKHLL